MNDHDGGCRVLVRSDEALVAETVRIALTARGLIATESDSTDAQAPAEVGLLITPLATLSTVGEAQRLISGSDVPWVVVSTTACGPGWAAVKEAGADVVVDSSTSLDQIVKTLIAVHDGSGCRDDGIPADVASLWGALAARLSIVPADVLARWCGRARGELPGSALPGDADAELREVEALLCATAAGGGRARASGSVDRSDPGLHAESS